MKLHKKTKKPPVLRIILCVLLIIGLIFVVFIYFFKTTSSNPINIKGSNDGGSNTTKSAQSQALSTNPLTQVNTNKSNDTEENHNNPNPERVEFTNVSIQGNFLHVGSLIYGFKAGTCTLSANNNISKKITLANQPIQQNNLGAFECPVFNVPLDNFPSASVWTITLTVTSGDETGASVSRNISI